MNQRNNLTIILSVFSILLVTSCEKSFLDKPPHDAITFEDAITTKDEMQNALTGLYKSMQSSAGFAAHVPLMGDIMADNVYISTFNTGRYLAFNNYTIFVDNSQAEGIWSSLYATILRANQIIEATIDSDTDVEQYKGEAYTIRALCYFQLVQVFAKPYSQANASLSGVPLILSYDIHNSPDRNSISEVYTQITTDLQTAISLLTIDKDSEYISPWVAKGLLSKVYQYKGDWNNALLLASELVNSSGYQLVDSASFLDFWSTTTATIKSGTLFEISVDGTINNTYLFSLYHQDGYGDAICSQELYDLYSSMDIRKSLMFPGNHQGDPGIIVDKYNDAVNSMGDDVKILRLAEIHLILAEAYYNVGNETMALQTLNGLAQLREPSFSGYTSSGIALLNDITFERRLELAFEGNRFFDMNRLGLDVNRNMQFPPNAQTLLISDHRRILPIPLKETNANPNISQNPGY